MTSAERVDIIKKANPFNNLDIVVFCAVILVIALSVMIAGRAKQASAVVITTPEQKLTYPIDKDREVEVEGKLTVVIKDGKVYVKNAVCPDKVCEHSGEISRSGSVIACLPSGIVITVTGETDFIEVG